MKPLNLLALPVLLLATPAQARGPAEIEFVEVAGGDFEGDGDVDGADFLMWQRG